MSEKKVRTRFAPSPTGFLHIGGLRTALYAYALAKHTGGDFILRIEDTDQKRSVSGATDALKDILTKFNLDWDEYYVQSERQKEGIYEKAAKKLVSEGHAFYCQCKGKNAKEEGYSKILKDPCRDKGLKTGAIKLKVPEGETLTYFDFVHKKEISWQSDSVYDATLLKSDGFPTYHLAVVVDDLDMGITHILRGHDWLPSTPIHLLVFKYLGGKHPEIGHLTDILSSETGKKLSKRRDSVFVEDYLNKGYLPDAILNFIMLLGWAPKNNRELFTLDEFVEEFDIKGLQFANPKFFMDKLDWLNGEYIRKLKDGDLQKKFEKQNKNFKNLSDDKKKILILLLKERIKKISDIDALTAFLFEKQKVDTKLFGKDYQKHLNVAVEVIQSLKTWDLESLNDALMERIAKNEFKTGDFFMSLRIAVAGSKFTPPINDCIIILGKDDVLERLKKLQ